MDDKIIFRLFESLGSTDENTRNEASDHLIEFYSTPESLPFLSSLYLTTDVIYIKESIIIGIRKALNDENLNKIKPDELQILLDKLVLMLTREIDYNLLLQIESFFSTIINKFHSSWESLDEYLLDDQNVRNCDYFYIFSCYLDTKTDGDYGEITEFTFQRLKYVLTENLPINSQLSAFRFIVKISLSENYHIFLEKFGDELKFLFQNVCQYSDNNNFLLSFIETLFLAEKVLKTSYFTKLICPLSDIIEYCLSDDADYTNSINLRSFINESLTISETNPNELNDLLINLIKISIKFYSTEIDVQMQRIDDYFPILKYIPIEERGELCSQYIQELIEMKTPASICAALSVFRGALISGIAFDGGNFGYFIEFYKINDFNVKTIAASTLIDVCEELSTEMEENIDSLLSMFCKDLIFVSKYSYEIRAQFVLTVFDAIRSVIIYAIDISDEICIKLIKRLGQYIQNGELNEQYQALLILMKIINKFPKIACNQQLYDFIFNLLESQDPNIRELCYNILMIYIESYPQYANVKLICDSISNEQIEECFTYFKIIGVIALNFGSDDSVKKFILDRFQLILDISMDDQIIESQDHRGSAIFSLFLIMIAYNDLIQKNIQNVINAIAKIIETHGLNDNNVNDISQGIEIFNSRVNITFQPELFEPIFGQIEIIYKKETFFENENLFSILNNMTNFVKCCKIHNIISYTWSAFQRLQDLMASDEKKDIEIIQSISDFIRTVYENCISEEITEMGKTFVGFIFEQLTEKQSSLDLECHLILILSTFAASNVECLEQYGIGLMNKLIEKMQSSFHNTAKYIVYFVKELADSDILMSFLNDDENNLQCLIDTLIKYLTPECKTNTLMQLNDNIISTLITIEKKITFMEIDDFYSLILPYLPASTDTNEFFDIYGPLIDSFSDLNAENQDSFLIVLIKFFSFKQSAKFLNDAMNSERGDLIVNLYDLICEKLNSVDDYQLFINEILNDDFQKAVFEYFLKYTNNLVG